MARTVKQIVYNVPGVTNTVEDLTQNLFQQNGKKVTKLGIQAPVGTRFYINTTDQDINKIECLMGKTGMYELDENDLIIQYLSFVKQFEKILDNDKTKAYITIGNEIIETAIQNRTYRFNYEDWGKHEKQTSSKVENSEGQIIATSQNYCKINSNIETTGIKRNPNTVLNDEKIKIENIYYDEYIFGYKYILQAENGIYDENAAKPIDFKNIIIDYVEEDV